MNQSPKFYSDSLLRMTQYLILGLKYEFNLPSSAFLDPDNDALTFKAYLNDNENLPTWLTFDEERKLLYGKPEVADITYLRANNRYYQIFTFTILTKDTVDLTAKASFNLIISNEGPSFNKDSKSERSQILILGNTYDWSVPNTAFSDPDKDVLSFSAFIDPEAALPNWLNFDYERKRLFGTPKQTDLGELDSELKYFKEYSIKIQAKDPTGLSNFFLYKLAVVNHSPKYFQDSFLHLSQSHILGLKYEFNLPSSAFLDPDGESLSFRASLNDNSELPAWLNFDKERKLLQGKPEVLDIMFIKEQNKYHQIFVITISVNDNVGLTAKSSFDLLIYNNAPIYNIDSRSTDKQNLILGYSYDWSIPNTAFLDPDDDPISYQAFLNENEKLPNWLTFDKDRKRFFGKPSPLDAGLIDEQRKYFKEYKFRVTVSDSVGLSAYFIYVLQIINRSPSFNSESLLQEDQYLVLGFKYEYNIPSSAFEDPDTSWLTFDSDRKILSGKPETKDIAYLKVENKYYQIFKLRITVFDNVELSSYVSFNLIVYNNAPTYNKNSYCENTQSLILGYSYDWSIPNTAFSDPNDDPISYQAFLNDNEKLPNWLSFDKDRKRFFGKPSSSDVGDLDSEKKYYKEYNLKVLVEDSIGLSENFNFKLIIINYSPEYNSESLLHNNQLFILGYKYEYSIPSLAFKDRENTVLTYKLSLEIDQETFSNLPSWLDFDSERKILSGKPDVKEIAYLKDENKFYQLFKIKTTVFDNVQLSSSSSFDLVVYNNAPIYIEESNSRKTQTLILGYYYDWSIPNTAFYDYKKDVLEYFAFINPEQPLPNWLNFDQDRKRLFGKPNTTDITLDSEQKYFNEFLINIKVLDSVGLSVNFVFKLIVLNNPPKFYSESLLEKTQYLKLGDKFNFNLPSSAFYDIDGDPLSYSSQLEKGEDLPSWLTFDKERKLFLGKPDIKDITYFEKNNSYYQIFKIIVLASDLVMLSSFAAFDLIIYNHPPIYIDNSNSQYDQILILGSQYDWSVPGSSFSDPDNEELIYYSYIYPDKKLPNWLNFDADRKRLFGFPTTLDIAYDSVQKMYYQTFNILVNVSDSVFLKAQLSFKLTILNNAPEVNYKIVKTDDLSQTSIMGRMYDYSLKEFSFLDIDKDVLLYSAWYILNDKEVNLPLWLEFDTERKRLFGTPQKSDIKYDSELYISIFILCQIYFFNFQFLILH